MKKKFCEISWGDIKDFSKVLYIILGVAAILYAVVIAMHILSEVWPIFGGTVDLISVGWQPFVVDVHLLRIGDIFIPAVTFGLIVFGENVPMPEWPIVHFAVVVAGAIFAHGILMTSLLYIRFVFKELKNGVSPFSKKMVARIYILAIIATILAVLDFSLIGLFIVIFAWLLFYIFNYGHKLQEESDTTL